MISEKKIGDVFKVTSGGTPSRKKQEYYKNGTIPWVKTGDLKGKYANEPKEYITELALANSSAKIFPKNTVLLAMYGATIGACSILKIAAATNQACGAILPSEKCDHVYLYYYLKSINKELISKGVGGAQPNISGGIIKSTKIPLPPLDQQKKIAAILDAADTYRQKTKALITKYDELTQSLFLDMFGDPVRNPKRWGILRFDELVADDCPLTYGIVQPGDEFENGIPCVRPVDLKMQYVNLSDLKRIDPEISSKFKRTILKGGEILLSVRGSVGVISIADESLKDSNVTRGIVPIWFDKYLANKLFFYYLYRTKSIQRRLSELARGATLIQINLKDLRELKLIKPPLEIQNQFADSVQAIEAQKAQAQASLAQAEDLFNSLLQRAFKGELTN